MNKTQKAEFVGQLTERLGNTPFIALVDFRGTTVAATNAMRRDFEKIGVDVQVVKNTLAKRAIAGTELEGLEQYFQDMTGIVFSSEDPVAAAKAVKEKLFS